jgi:Uma2 family endonuclease
MQEYIEQGVQLGLLIDDLRSVGKHRKNCNVYVYRPNIVFELLKNPEVVNCDPDSSGFGLKIAK